MTAPHRSSAPAALECRGCGEVVEFEIPVKVWLEQDPDGTASVMAKVDDDADWEQPMWDHTLYSHGPTGE